MALSLADKLKQKRSQQEGLQNTVMGPGGQQIVGTREQVRQLTEAHQLPQQPTSPQEAAVQGANPDAAKMVGSAAQQNAMMSNPDGPQTLQDRLRTGQTRSEATQSERDKIKQSQSLQSLGGLGERVGNLIASALPSSDPNTQQTPQLQVSDDVTDPEVRSLLGRLAQNPSDPNLLYRAQKALGVSGETAETMLGKYFKSGADAIASAAAAQTPDTLTVSSSQGDLFDSETEKAEVADALGLTVEQLNSMSLQDLQDAVAEVERSAQSDVADLRKLAGDMNASPAERQAARQALAEAGATGVMDAESQVANIAEQVDNADQIEVMGKSMSVEDLLSDEGMSSLIKDYLSSDAETRASLDASNPDLTQWIKDNEAALGQMADQLEDTQEGLVASLAESAKFNQTPVGELPEEFMTAMYGENWKDGVFAGVALEDSPMTSILKDENTPPHVAQNLMDALNEFKGDPKAMKELSKMSRAELNELGLGTKDSERWNNFRESKAAREAIDSLSPGDNEGLAQALFGPNATVSDMENMLAKQRIAELMGFSDGVDGIAHVLDADGDGKIDSNVDLKKIKSYIGTEGTLRDLQAGSGTLSLSDRLKDAMGGKLDITKMDPGNSTRKKRLKAKLADALSDGVISPTELKDLERYYNKIPKSTDTDKRLYGIEQDKKDSAKAKKDAAKLKAEAKKKKIKKLKDSVKKGPPRGDKQEKKSREKKAEKKWNPTAEKGTPVKQDKQYNTYINKHGQVVSTEKNKKKNKYGHQF